MKVKELIEELQKYNPESRVMINGFIKGLDDISGASEHYVTLNVYDGWFYGKHMNDDKNGDCLAVLIK